MFYEMCIYIYCLPVCALSQVAGLLHHRLRRDMKRGRKLIARPQSVGLVRNSLWGASAKTNNQSFENILEKPRVVNSIEYDVNARPHQSA